MKGTATHTILLPGQMRRILPISFFDKVCTLKLLLAYEWACRFADAPVLSKAEEERRVQEWIQKYAATTDPETLGTIDSIECEAIATEVTQQETAKQEDRGQEVPPENTKDTE